RGRRGARGGRANSAAMAAAAASTGIIGVSGGSMYRRHQARLGSGGGLGCGWCVARLRAAVGRAGAGRDDG
ncbi:hypothetical protein, partial [Xanthomonas translucens]|uniref:hypothetical protein n=1 Tax=Xanthomonas campestris pv. translucens TaxID=343 RepID=UPI001E37CEEA